MSWILAVLAVIAAMTLWRSLKLVRAAAAVNKPLPNSPRRFLAENRREPGKQVVACLGASITHGVVSFNWVDQLQEKLGSRGFQFVNAGINGEMAYNALKRLPRVIECRPDFLVVLVGTNDVMATMSPAAERRYVKMLKLPVRPTLMWYRENLEAIVKQAKEKSTAKIALASLPVLGEDLYSEANQKILAYCGVVKEIAEREGVTYLPVNEQMRAYLEAANHTPGSHYTPSLGLMTRALYQHFGRGMSYDEISAQNGLLLTTECIHLNSRGGGMVAEQVEAFVRGGTGLETGEIAGAG